jgi:hypothetical protein
MNAQQKFARTSSARGPSSRRLGSCLARIVCAAIFMLVALGPSGPAAGFDSFNAFTSLEDAAGIVIVSDRDEGTNLIDPIPPNTAFTSFIGGGAFSANAYVDTNAIIGVAAGMVNRTDKLTSSASFSLDIENPSPFPRRMNLGFLIFPGQLRLVARNAEASFNISVSVVGNVITDENGLVPRFEAGGTLKTDAAGVTTWTNLPFGDDIGLPADGTSSGLINIPLRAPTLTAFFGPNAKGNIQYDMSVTIDATDAAAGGGFLEFACQRQRPADAADNRRHPKHRVCRGSRAEKRGIGNAGDGWLCGGLAFAPAIAPGHDGSDAIPLVLSDFRRWAEWHGSEAVT